jgi:hypothetical protein
MEYLAIDLDVLYMAIWCQLCAVLGMYIGWNINGQLVKKYILNILIALDQLGNAILLGDPDNTISGRLGVAIYEGECRLCKPICKLLDFVFRDKNHCKKSIEADEGKRSLWDWGKSTNFALIGVLFCLAGFWWFIAALVQDVYGII